MSTTPRFTLVEDHGWLGGYAGKVGKAQYVALLEAVGSWRIARKKMAAVIIWRLPANFKEEEPPESILRSWELDWQEGKVTVDDADVRKMRQRLMAIEEWSTREAIDAARQAATALNLKAAAGTLDAKKQVQLQYAGMNVAYMTKETAIAYGSPKPTALQVGRLTINAGERPPRKLKAPTQKQLVTDYIDAEVREIIGNSDESA